MKKEDLWDALIQKNPRLAGDESEHITLTRRGLRKIFEQAFDRGYEQGFDNGRAHEEMRNHNKTSSSSTKAFTDLFGKDNPFKT